MPGEPMEAAQRSAEYVFQGIMYYFRREKVCPRYQFTLKDPVDPALLQQALDAALEAAPYYRVRLVWEKRKAFLEPNSEPCLVYPDSVMREMPEQTNGYFFAVHCAQNTVYFDWFHFIADGHGVSPFLTRILELYCNLRYGTAFANPPIPCSPAYDIAKLVEQYPLQVMDETTMQREVVETCEEPMHRIRIRFAKKDLVAKGVQNGVKPFCALMGLLCIALGEYLGKDTIQYSYSADTRDAMGAPNARYNCVCSFQDGVTLHEGVRLEEFVQQMDSAVKDSLTAERKRRKMADQMGWVYLVDQQKAPLRIKQRVFQMGEYISGIPADFWFSYLGNPLMPATPELAQYITDFGVWVPPEGGSLCVEASTLNGIITLCIENKAEMPGLAASLRTAFAKEGANLVITGRNVKKLEEAKNELEAKYGIRVLPVQADVCAGTDNEATVQNVVNQAVDTFGGIQVLVNNAQASASGVPLAEHTTEQFDLALYSGLYAAFYYMKACYPYLAKSKGSVINFASGAGLFGNFGQCSYAAAKEGIRGLSRVAATEWGPDDINVNVVCPLAWTAKLEQFQQAYPEAFKANVKMPPMGHYGNAELEIGRVCVQLAMPDFKFMSGETLTLEGGMGQRP